MRKVVFLFLSVFVLLPFIKGEEWQGVSVNFKKNGALQVSPDGRYLQHKDGTLFSIWQIRRGNCSTS